VSTGEPSSSERPLMLIFAVFLFYVCTADLFIFLLASYNDSSIIFAINYHSAFPSFRANVVDTLKSMVMFRV
jgi:hypothetical protein